MSLIDDNYKEELLEALDAKVIYDNILKRLFDIKNYDNIGYFLELMLEYKIEVFSKYPS